MADKNSAFPALNPTYNDNYCKSEQWSNSILNLTSACMENGFCVDNLYAVNTGKKKKMGEKNWCAHTAEVLDRLPGDGELEVPQEEVGIYEPLPTGGEEWSPVCLQPLLPNHIITPLWRQTSDKSTESDKGKLGAAIVLAIISSPPCSCKGRHAGCVYARLSFYLAGVCHHNYLPELGK